MAYHLYLGNSAAGGSTTHDTSGALTGQGSTVAGSATRYRSHATSGILAGQGSEITGAAAHKVRHETSGILAGQGSIITGSSTRFRAHSTSGVLAGQGSTITGSSVHVDISWIADQHTMISPLTGIGHEINGVLASADALSVYRQALVNGDPLLASEAGDARADTGYPVIESLTQTTFAVDATAHAVSMPATVNAGDGLIVILTTDGSATVTTPNGWKQLYTEPNGTALRGSAYAKVGRGTEGGTTVDFVTSATENAAAQVYRISNWNGTLAGIQSGTAGEITTGTTADPASLTAYWGSAKTIWLATCHTSTSQTISSGPASYTNLTQTSSAAATTGAQVISARRSAEAATEDPGVFTTSGSNASKVYNTIAVAPAYVGAYYEHFDITQGTTLWAGMYTSQPLAVADTGITRAVIVLHGSGLDAAEYQNVVQNNLVDYLGKAIVITPLFAEAESDPETDQLFWGSTWSSLGRSDASLAWRISSGGVLDELIDHLYATFTNIELVVMAGHSAGGQLANRYSAARPPDTRNRYLVSAASSYVYPGTERVDGVGGWAVPGSPATYNDWKYGLDVLSTVSYVDAIGADALRARLPDAKVHYMVGALDNDPADTSMDLTAAAATQGSTRVERQQLYYAYLNYFYASTHSTSSVLSGQGSAATGSSARFRSFAASGALPGQTAAITGDAERFTGAVTHATNGVLAGQGSTIAGAATRYRQHTSSGALPGLSSAISGSAARFSGSVTHDCDGSLAGQSAVISAYANRYRNHEASGALLADLVEINGVSLHLKLHSTSGSLAGQGALVSGVSGRTRRHEATGQIVATIGAVSGAAVNGADIVFSSAGIVVDYATQNLVVSLAQTSINVSYEAQIIEVSG